MRSVHDAYGLRVWVGSKWETEGCRWDGQGREYLSVLDSRTVIGAMEGNGYTQNGQLLRVLFCYYSFV